MMNNKISIFASTFGVIMALAGIEHGIGEMLQGNVTPDGLMILSWPEAEFFRSLSGEPAMTILPNMLITGILAVIISIALLIWCVFFMRRKSSGLVMILIAIPMLLFGGGIFPPLITIVIGMIATKIDAPLTWLRVRLSAQVRAFLAKPWRWLYVVCVLSWIVLLVGPGILGYYFGIENPVITLLFMGIAFGSFGLTLLSSFAYQS